MSRPSNQLRDEAGFTLVEVLFSCLILIIALVVAQGVLIFAKQQEIFSNDWIDRSDQMRVALSQMTEDLMFGTGSCNVVQSTNGYTFTTEAYQMSIQQQMYDPGGTLLTWHSDWGTNWPGWLESVEALQVKYSLRSDLQFEYVLIREVQDQVGTVYTQQMLARHLNKQWSKMECNGNRLLVRLATLRKVGEKDVVLQVVGQYYLPNIPVN